MPLESNRMNTFPTTACLSLRGTAIVQMQLRTNKTVSGRVVYRECVSYSCIPVSPDYSEKYPKKFIFGACMSHIFPENMTHMASQMKYLNIVAFVMYLGRFIT